MVDDPSLHGSTATPAPLIADAIVPVALDVAVLEDPASIALESALLGLVLQRLALIAERAIPGAAAVSVTVVRDRTASSAAFPGLADLAAHQGIGSVVAIGLAVAGPATAALNVHRTGPGHTDLAAMTATIRTARVFAASAVLATTSQHATVELAEVAARVVATATAGGDPDLH